MSIFNSINICSPQPKMISLQEESPEIPTKAKKMPPNSSNPEKSNLFTFSENNLPNSNQPGLLLSYDIDKSNTIKKDEIQDVKNIQEFILKTIKNDDDLTLREKITFSFLLVLNSKCFNEEFIREFNEEECHLSLLNWVWRYKKKLKQFQLQNQLKNNFFDNFEIFLPQYNKLLIEINIIMELLINILNFFVFLPINSSDILHLKLYEKLIKIKGFINSYANDYLLNLINFVLNKWKTVVDEENEVKIITRFKLSQLGAKRPRTPDEKEDKEDTEADSVDYNEDNIKININNNSIKYSNLNKKIKNKNNIKVSFDLQQNSVIYFKKDDIPFQISLDKKKINKSNFTFN